MAMGDEETVALRVDTLNPKAKSHGMVNSEK
jgi:hypothetical protein